MMDDLLASFTNIKYDSLPLFILQLKLCIAPFDDVPITYS